MLASHGDGQKNQGIASDMVKHQVPDELDDISSFIRHQAYKVINDRKGATTESSNTPGKSINERSGMSGPDTLMHTTFDEKGS